MAPQHDAHVRARRTLLRRVVDRRIEWGGARVPGETAEQRMARIEREAATALAGYEWSGKWWVKYGAYSPYEGQEIKGTYKDVPASSIHNIMCRMRRKDT